MTLYVDPVQMTQDIRAHVLEHGHEVAPSDDPLGWLFGYVCLECAHALGAEESPRMVVWKVRFRNLGPLEASTIYRVDLHDLRSDQAVRDRLTRYLNGFVGLDFDTGPRVQVASRYKRPWVI